MSSSCLSIGTRRVSRATAFLRALFTLALLTMAQVSFAFEPFVVKDIRVEGIQRTEPGTIFGYLPVKVGERFTEEMATEAVRKLYATGLFSDVRIDTAGNVVVVVVQERPTIASVTFTGMREFESKDIINSLRQVGFGEGRIFDQSMLEQAEFELKQQYLTKGKYGVDITPTVTPLPRNRVGINFDIFEGSVAKIREIKIVGNKAFKESTLLDQFALTTPGWLTWYTNSDKYSREKLERDIESLKSFYLDRGYLEFKSEPPQVTISPDRNDIYITITISEGEPYKVSQVKLAGELLGLESEITQLIQLKSGEVFSGAKANATSKSITDYLGSLGYAFANVNPNPVLDKEKREADVTFYVDPSRRVYVRKIQISGNHRTRDAVIRREISQQEAAWYDAGSIKMSRDRIDRRGYFQDVKIGSEPVPGSPDQVDVNIEVKEKPTGMVNVGVGYGTNDGVVFMAGISEENVFGSGQNLTFQFNTSSYNRSFVLAHTDPYFTNAGISKTTSLYWRDTRPYNNTPGNYEVKTRGVGLNFGVPISEFDRVFVGANFEHNSLSTYSNSALAYQQYIDLYGESTNAVIFNVGWAKDARDSAVAPTKGGLTRLKADVGTMNLKYYLLTAQQQYYLPIGRDYTLALNGMFDYGKSYGTGYPYPVIKNVYAGGIGTVRGYSGNTLGPTSPLLNDPTQFAYIGGSKRVVGNVQFYLPFPGSQQDRTLRWYVFADGGQVWGQNIDGSEQSINFGDLRYSAGVGLSWTSPLGPLQISYAKALNSKPGDNIQQFQFQIGTGF